MLDSLFDEGELPPIDPSKVKPQKVEKPAPKTDAERFANLPPDVAALFADIEEPGSMVLQGRYPPRAGRKPLYVKEAEGGRPVRNEGRIMGHLYPNGCLLKICGTASVLQRPPSIAFQCEPLEAEGDAIKCIAVYVTDRQAYYTVPFSIFKAKAFIIARPGSGNQWALPLPYWRAKQY